MNNDISIRPSYLTASAPAEAFAETLGFAQPARISMNNDRFNVLDENGQAVLPPSLELQVIMLWENDTRVYYPADSYDAANPSPPACYSDNKVTPSVGAMQPQNDLCTTCPRAVWDQPTPRGNLVPACKNQYKVACFVAGAKGQVFLLTVPPASRKAYEQYRKYLRAHNAGPEQVITRLAYADKAFQFSFQVWVNQATDAMVRRAFETDEPAMIVNAFDKPRQTALPAPKPEAAVTPPLPPSPSPPTSFVESTPAPQPSAETSEPPLRRRGRPPKGSLPPPIDVSSSTPPAASAAPPTPPQPALAPKQGNSGFGMEPAQKPPADIQEALNRAFGP